MELGDAVERGDLDELLRLIDSQCERRDWDGVLELRDRCQRAVERGKQLWPAAHHAEYRLALEAPGEFAGAMLVEGAGRFSLGPIAEVAASTHTWAELAPHAPAGPTASLAAHERVLRGEDLTGVALTIDPLELPLVLQPWEPHYALATYRSHTADFPTPPVPALQSAALPTPAGVRDDPIAVHALRDLAAAWSQTSDGRVEVVAVQGDALGALATLGMREARVGELPSADALAWMAWTAASGGAHGRRRAAATGRFDAWNTVGALVGLDAWPFDADSIGAAANMLHWFWWDAAAPVTGWALRLAIQDDERGCAWAITATDAR